MPTPVHRDVVPIDPATAPLGRGTPAPDFTLMSTPDELVGLSEYRGRPVVLVFYPADWSAVCGDQIAFYNELLPEFQRLGAELVGISVDSVYSHVAFAESRNLRFPLLADFQPRGEVARKYGVYRQNDGVSERALFVLDQNGVVWWSSVSSILTNPGADGILTALETLQGQEVSR
jgi:peroxiredoxin